MKKFLFVLGIWIGAWIALLDASILILTFCIVVPQLQVSWIFWWSYQIHLLFGKDKKR